MLVQCWHNIGECSRNVDAVSDQHCNNIREI